MGSAEGRSESPDPGGSGKRGLRLGWAALWGLHYTGCSEGMGGHPATSPRQHARMSQSLTQNSKHTPPCVMHTFTGCHHSETPLLSAGFPQQLGCAGAGVLAELA